MVSLLKAKSFIRSGEGSIASYSYTDIAEGIGYSTFYGAIVAHSATGGGANIVEPILINFTDYNAQGTVVFNEGVSIPSAGTVMIDKDFDLTPFTFPKTIKGVAIVNFSGGYHSSYAGTQNGYYKIIIRKVSGGVETDLVTTYTKTIGSDTDVYESFTVPLAIPITNFKSGDILRLTIQGIASEYTDATANTMRIYCDPMNSTPPSGASFTYLKFRVPFRIDV